MASLPSGMNDLISRQAAINLIQEDKIKLVEPYLSIYKSAGCIKEAETQVLTCDRHIEMIKKIPTADVRPNVRGEWIIHETENDRYDDMICPFCKKTYTVDAYRIDDIGFTADDFNFCPNCGADMRG